MSADKILATYSPEDVVVVISNSNFSHTISGYTDGSFLSITRTVPFAAPYVGADGSNARVVRAVKNRDVTLTLHQASESNDVLTRLLALDSESRNNDNLFSITIKDVSGRTVASSSQAYIGNDPDIDFGTDVSDRAWTLHAIGMEIFIGGNGKFTASTFGTVNDLGYTPNEYWNPVTQ